MRPSVRAYLFADRVSAFLHSQEFFQKTMAMEACEFRDYLATELDVVLQGPLPASIPPLPVPDDFPVDPPAVVDDAAPLASLSAITHVAAWELLQNTPKPIRETYRRQRREGQSPADALGAAMEAMQQMQEAAYEIQGSN